VSARFSALAADRKADAVLKLLDGGTLKVYDGERPPSPGGPMSGQRMIALLRFGSPAFLPAERGVAEARPIEPDTSASRSGDPTWFAACAATGEVVFDGTVGPEGTLGPDGEVHDLEMSGDDVAEGTEVGVVRFTYSERRE